MKSLLFAIVVIIMDVAACGGSPGHYVVDYLKAHPDNVILESQEGASGAIYISSNVHWKIVSQDEPWLDIHPYSGDDDGKVTVTALSSNTSSHTRSCTLIINGRQKVTITQKYE